MMQNKHKSASNKKRRTVSPREKNATAGGYTMLMLLVEENNLKEIRSLFDRTPNLDIDIQNKTGQTALLLAARNGNLAVTEYLVSRGANLNIQNKSGQTPLFIACWFGFYSIVEVLLRESANVNLADYRGWTPLMIACYHEHRDIVQLLLQSNADITAIDCFGKRAIDRCKDPDIYSILEELEAGLDLAGPDFVHNHHHNPNHTHTHNTTHGNERLTASHSLGYHYPNRHSRRQPNSSSPDRERVHSLEDKHEIRCQLPTGFSPKRTSGQFIHDYDIYLMHLRAGYYSSKGRRSNSKGSSKSRGRSGVGRSPDNEDLEDIYASHRTQGDEYYKKNLSQKFKAVASMNSSSKPLGSIDSNVHTVSNTNESIARIRGSAQKNSQADKFSKTAPSKSYQNKQAKLQAISKGGSRNRKASPDQESMDSVKRRYLETRSNTKTRNTDGNNSRANSKEREREQRMLASYGKEVIEEDSHDGDVKRALERYIIDYSSRMDRIVNKKVSYALNFDWKRNAYKIRKTFYHLLLKKSREFTEALLGKMEASYENLTFLREGKATGPVGFNDFKRKIREFTKELAGIWEMEGCEQTLRAEEEGLSRMLIGTDEVDRLLLADLEDNCDKEILRLAGSDQGTMMFLKDELQLNVDKIFKSLNNTIGRELSKSESLVTKLLSENVKDIFDNLDKNLQKISVEQMEKLVTEMNSASTKSIFTDQSLKSPQSVNFPLSVGLKNEVKNINIPETGTTLYPEDANRILSANSKSEKDLRGVDSLGSDSGSSRGRRIFERTHAHDFIKNKEKLNYESVEGVSYAGRPNLVIERVGEVELRHWRGAGGIVKQQYQENKNLSIVRANEQKKVDIKASPGPQSRINNDNNEQEEEESEEERVLRNAVKPIPQELQYQDEYEQRQKQLEGSRKVVYSNVKAAVGETKSQKTGIVTPKEMTFADVEEQNAQQKKEREDDAQRRRNVRGSFEIIDEVPTPVTTTTPTTTTKTTTVKLKVPEPQQSKPNRSVDNERRVEDKSRVSQSQSQERVNEKTSPRQGVSEKVSPRQGVNEKLSPRQALLEGSNPPSLRSARAEYKERRLSQEELKVESKEESQEGQGSKESINEEGSVGTQGKRKTGSKARDEMKSILTKIDSLWGKFDEALARPKESFDRSKRTLNESLNKSNSNSLRQQELEEAPASASTEGRRLPTTGQKDRSFQKTQEEDLKRRETIMKELADLKKETNAILEAKNKKKEQTQTQTQTQALSSDRLTERDQSDGSRQDLKDIRSQYKRTKRQDSVSKDEEEEKLDRNQKTIDENKLKTGHYHASPRTQQKDDSPIKTTSPKEKFSPLKGYLDSIKFERDNLRKFQSARSQQEEDIGARVSTNPENTSSSARQYLDRNKNRSFGDDILRPERDFKSTPEKPSPKKFSRGGLAEYEEEERRSNIKQPIIAQEQTDLPKRSNRDLGSLGVERAGKSPLKRQEYENRRASHERESLGYREEHKNTTPERRNPLAGKTHSPRDQTDTRYGGGDKSVNKRSPGRRDQPNEDVKKHLRNEGQTLAETRAETRIATEKHSLATSSQSTPPKDKGSKKEGDSDQKASSPKSQFSKDRSQSREEHTHYGSPRKKSPLLRPPNSPTTPEARFDVHRQPGFGSANRREQEERIPIPSQETQNFQRGQRLESATSDLEPAYSGVEREKRRQQESREEEDQRIQRATGRTSSHLPSSQETPRESLHTRSDVRHQSSPLTTSNKKPGDDAIPDEETMAQRRIEREARLQKIFAAQGLKRATTNEIVQPEEKDTRDKKSQEEESQVKKPSAEIQKTPEKETVVVTPEKKKQPEESPKKDEKKQVSTSNELNIKKPETREESELNIQQKPLIVEENKGEDQSPTEHKQLYTMQTVTEVSTPREVSPMRRNRGPQGPQHEEKSSFERRAMSRQTLSSNPESRIYNESHESSMKERSSVESENSPSQRMNRSPKTRQAENKLEQRPNRPSGSPFQRQDTAGNESGVSEKKNLSGQKEKKDEDVVSEKKEEGKSSTLGSSQVGAGGVSIVPKFDFSESASENETNQQPQAKVPEKTQLVKKLLEAENASSSIKKVPTKPDEEKIVENKNVTTTPNNKPVDEEAKSSEKLDVTDASTRLETQADLTQRTHRITEPASSYRSPGRTQRELQTGQSIEYDNGIETAEDNRIERVEADNQSKHSREHQEVVVTLPSESVSDTQTERVQKRSANIKRQEREDTKQESSPIEIDEGLLAEKQEKEKEKDLSTQHQNEAKKIQESGVLTQDQLIHTEQAQTQKSPVRESQEELKAVETKDKEEDDLVHSHRTQKSPAKEHENQKAFTTQDIESQEKSKIVETQEQTDFTHSDRTQKSPVREHENQADLIQKQIPATQDIESQEKSKAVETQEQTNFAHPDRAQRSPVREHENLTDSVSVQKSTQGIESQEESKVAETKDQGEGESAQSDGVHSQHQQRSPAKVTQTDLIQKQNQATETQSDSISVQKSQEQDLTHPDRTQKSPAKETQTDLIQKQHQATETQSEAASVQKAQGESKTVENKYQQETQGSLTREHEIQTDSVSVQKSTQQESKVTEGKDALEQNDLAPSQHPQISPVKVTQTDLIQKQNQATETQTTQGIESQAVETKDQEPHRVQRSPAKETQTDLIQKQNQATETQTTQGIESQEEQSDSAHPDHKQKSPAKETQTESIQKQNQATDTQTDSNQSHESVEKTKEQTQDVKQKVPAETSQGTQILKVGDDEPKVVDQGEEEEEEKTPVLSTVTEKSSRTSVEPQSEKDLSDKGVVRTQKGSSTVPPISHLGGIGLIERQAISSSNSLGAIDTPKFFDQRLEMATEEASPSQDYLNSRNLKNQIIEEEKRIQGHQISEDLRDKTESEGDSETLKKAEKSQTQERRIFTQDSFSIKQKPAVTEANQKEEEKGEEQIKDKHEVHPEKSESSEITPTPVPGNQIEDQHKSPEKVNPVHPVSITVTPPREAEAKAKVQDEGEKEVDFENRRAHKKLSDKGQTTYPTGTDQGQYHGQEQEFEYNEEDYRDHQNLQYEQHQAYMENNRRLAAGAYFPGGQSRITNLHTVEEEEDVMGTRESYQPSPKAFEESRDSAQQQNTLGDDDYLNIHKEEVPKQKETKIEDEIEKLSKESGSVIIADFEHSYEEDQENGGDDGNKSQEQGNKKTLEELIGGEVSSIVYDVDPGHQDRVNTSVSNEKNIIPKSMEFFRKSGKSQNELRKDSDSKTDEDYQRDDSNNLGRNRSNRGSGTFQPKSQEESVSETGELYKTPIKTSSVTRLAQPEEILGGDDHEHGHEQEEEEDLDVHVVDSEVNSQAGPGSVEDRFGIQSRDEVVGQIPESIRETFGKSGKKVVVAKIPQILTLSELTKKIIDEGRTEENQNVTPVRERRDDDVEERNILEERKTFESPFSYHYAENADHASSHGYPTPERSFIPKQESAANSQFDSPIKKLIDAANQKTEKLSNILSTVDRIIEGNRYIGGDQSGPNMFASGGQSSFNQNFSKGIPVPSPSKYVKAVRRNQIDQIPLSESFHHTGQTAEVANRQRSMSYNPNNSVIHLDASYLSANFAPPRDRHNLSFSGRGNDSLNMEPNEKLE